MPAPSFRLFLAIATVSISAAVAPHGGFAQTDAAPQMAAARATRPTGQFLEGTYHSDLGSRGYWLYLPYGYDGSRLAPLVVMLHGCTQSAVDFAVGTRMNSLADELGFVVLYPDQHPSANPQKCWNWYDPAHQARGGGEPALIAGMTRQTMEQFPVDSTRIYVAGVSAGGAMALIMAATYPDLYAATGSHSGVAYGAARNMGEALAAMQQGVTAAQNGETVVWAMGRRSRAVPAILFHGASDVVVNPANLEAIRQQWAHALGAAGATLMPPERSNGHVGRYTTIRSVERGPDGTPMLEAWIVRELGHAWSGGAPEGSFTDPRGPDASREMVRFFLEHPHNRGERP